MKIIKRVIPLFVSAIVFYSCAKTADAIGVSSTIDEIQKKYAVTKLTDISDSGSILKMYDSLKGIAFETDEKGICQAIIIHNSEEALKTTSLPLR